MSKEEYLEMLYQKLNIPRQLLIKYIHSVGTNEENIKDYAMNASCAVVRKDNGFQIDYTAEMINNKDQKIDQLKQQLAEKDKEVKKLNWQLKDKDFTIKNLNHSLSVAPNANAGQRARIDELTKIVKEKDKEIEILKQELEEINAGYDFTYEQSSGAIKELKQNQTQFAIQELEKVKILIQNAINFVRPNFVEVYDAINKQIKELKGEKDEKL